MNGFAGVVINIGVEIKYLHPDLNDVFINRSTG